MKKKAILTFHNACNFGAVLQAYALKNALQKTAGIPVDILDYRNACIEAEYAAIGRINWENNPIKEIAKTVLCLPYRVKRNRCFRKFSNDYLEIKNQSLTKEQLTELMDAYDSIVVGSDQVWNLDITGKDYTFFLDFVDDKKKCTSYAASIGKSSFSEDEKACLTELLSSFRKISFRESELLPVFSPKLPHVSMCVNLDPVFLLDSKEWRRLTVEKSRKPYVLFFMTGTNPGMNPAIQFAKKLADEKGMDAVFLSDQDCWYKFRDWHHCGAVMPQEFLSLIDQAECVVTNSFHATSFSIILHTPFYVETNLPRSGRVLSILDETGLGFRRLESGKPVSEDKVEIDWNRVDMMLVDRRTQAYAYLKEI